MCNYPLTSIASAGEPSAEVLLALAGWPLGQRGGRPGSAGAWTLPPPLPTLSAGGSRDHRAGTTAVPGPASGALDCRLGGPALSHLLCCADRAVYPGPEPQAAIKLGGPRKQTWIIRAVSPRSGVFSWSQLGFRYLGEGVDGGVFCMPFLPLQISPRGNLKKIIRFSLYL